MQQFIIHPPHLERLKTKLRRKYNQLTDADLVFVAGEEQQFVDRLAHRIRREPSYVLFTIQKALAQIDTNRL